VSLILTGPCHSPESLTQNEQSWPLLSTTNTSVWPAIPKCCGAAIGAPGGAKLVALMPSGPPQVLGPLAQNTCSWPLFPTRKTSLWFEAFAVVSLASWVLVLLAGRATAYI
jgi:hypothetical protein